VDAHGNRSREVELALIHMGDLVPVLALSPTEAVLMAIYSITAVHMEQAGIAWGATDYSDKAMFIGSSANIEPFHWFFVWRPPV